MRISDWSSDVCSSDLIELHGAQGLLVNVTCDESLSLEEYEYISARVSEIASDEADAKIGMSINPNLNGELRVTVVATGLTGSGATAQMPTLAQPNRAGTPRVAQLIRPAEPARYGQSQQIGRESSRERGGRSG